jgi:hypothetical protein
MLVISAFRGVTEDQARAGGRASQLVLEDEGQPVSVGVIVVHMWSNISGASLVVDFSDYP